MSSLLYHTHVRYRGHYFHNIKQRFQNDSPETLGPPKACVGHWALFRCAM